MERRPPHPEVEVIDVPEIHYTLGFLNRSGIAWQRVAFRRALAVAPCASSESLIVQDVPVSVFERGDWRPLSFH